MRLGSRISTAVILLFALFSESLQQLEAVSGRTLPTRVPRNQVGAGAIHSSSKRPTLLTYHGFVEDAQGPQPVILHVLVKAKRLPDGSFSVRAVSYAERVVLQSIEPFAPSPKRLDMFLEFQAGADQPWQSMQFIMLGLLVAQGPFVYQLEVPLGVDVKALRLRVLDWPIYHTLDLQKLAMNSLHGQNMKLDGPFQHAVVISDIHGIDTTAAAQLLAAHMAHHLALGFDQYLVYTRGPEIFEALVANAVTASYIQAGLLQLVTMESLQVPSYDDRRVDRTYPFHQSYDPMKMIAYNHAALMMWGDRFRLAILDPDEFWSSHASHSQVGSWFDTCFPYADLIMSTRVEVVCNDCPLNGGTELSYLQQHWNESDPTDVLKHFSKVVTFSQDPKSIFWPDKVGQVWLHRPHLLPGSHSVLVTIDETQREVVYPDQCIYMVHMYNLFKHRIPDDMTSVYNPLRWLAQEERSG